MNVAENLFTKDSIRTFTGKYLNIHDINPESICIEDIAHSLSMQCRFAAHLPRFYSVAQHCVCACFKASKQNKIAALLHDASEAYLLDMPKPFKDLLPEYKAMKSGLMMVIANKFGFEYPLNDEIKIIDSDLLQNEWDSIMLNKQPEYVCLDPIKAKSLFLEYYEYYF